MLNVKKGQFFEFLESCKKHQEQTGVKVHAESAFPSFVLVSNMSVSFSLKYKHLIFILKYNT